MAECRFVPRWRGEAGRVGGFQAAGQVERRGHRRGTICESQSQRHGDRFPLVADSLPRPRSCGSGLLSRGDPCRHSGTAPGRGSGGTLYPDHPATIGTPDRQRGNGDPGMAGTDQKVCPRLCPCSGLESEQPSNGAALRLFASFCIGSATPAVRTEAAICNAVVAALTFGGRYFRIEKVIMVGS